VQKCTRAGQRTALHSVTKHALCHLLRAPSDPTQDTIGGGHHSMIGPGQASGCDSRAASGD
jgi:hypothetical protein